MRTRPNELSEFFHLRAADFEVADFEDAGKELDGLSVVGSAKLGEQGRARGRGRGRGEERKYLRLGLGVPYDGHVGRCWCGIVGIEGVVLVVDGGKKVAESVSGRSREWSRV